VELDADLRRQIMETNPVDFELYETVRRRFVSIRADWVALRQGSA
jgi:hypothetical protein